MTRIATRNGVPAYIGAPERRRQSSIPMPTELLSGPMLEPTLLQKLFGRGG